MSSKIPIKEIEKWKKEIDEYNERWFHHPERLTSIDDVGEQEIRWLQQKFYTLRLISVIPLYERAYDFMVKRGNFSRKNAFGEMHGDRYMWVEKCDHSKIIVYEEQSCKIIYIYTFGDPFPQFHARELYYKYSYPTWKKTELKGITVEKFRNQNFLTGTINSWVSKSKTERFDAFEYGDGRDRGYLFSCKGINDKLEDVANFTGYAIKNIEYWETYIDDPSQLE